MSWSEQNIKTSWKTKYRPRYEGFMLTAYLCMILFFGMILSNAVRADPTVSNVTITYVRIYSAGSASDALLFVAGVPSTFCGGTANFMISLSDAGGQGMLAAALAAVTSGNTVSLEISNATGCTVEGNWGPQLQSLYLNNH